MVPERDTADWPKQIADQVEHYVGLVHDKVTVKVVKAIRGVVFGLILAIVGLTAVVLLIVMAIRVLSIAFFGRVWAAHLVVAVIFAGTGWICMRKRYQPSAES
jgi:Putative Actinobacterial Holin-X, holin superfamily III